MSPKPRTPARPGLSIVDANHGRLVTFGPDVLDMKKTIEDRWPGLIECVFDEFQEEWCIIEHCKDGVDRLCFSTPVLCQATYDRIHKADQASASYIDPNKAYEAADREEEREKDFRLSETIGEASERLYYALRKDGVLHRPQVYFS